MILKIIKLFSYVLIFLKQFYFLIFGLKIIRRENPENNFESLCISRLESLLVIIF
jgi:hypothetical protein